MNYERYARSLGFSVEEKLEPSSCIVFKVRSGGQIPYVLKIAQNPQSEVFLRREYEILSLIRHDPNITNLVHKIEGRNRSPMNLLKNLIDSARYVMQEMIENGVCINQNYRIQFALLKDYYEGRVGNQMTPKGHVRLHYFLRSLHKKGFANLDIFDKNIIVNEMGNPKIIDLSHYKKRDELSEERFREYAEEDLFNLKCIYEKKNHATE